MGRRRSKYTDGQVLLGIDPQKDDGGWTEWDAIRGAGGDAAGAGRGPGRSGGLLPYVENQRLDHDDLRAWSFRESEIRGSSFVGSDLRGVDMVRADVSRSDFRDADLRNANLGGARFSVVDLRGADLRGADVGETTWDNVRVDERTQGVPSWATTRR